jgi:hypothetical protein
MRKSQRNSVGRDILEIRTSLASIAQAVQRLAPILQAAAAVEPGSARIGGLGRTLKLSTKRRADLKLQGQYMGYLRSLKPRQKAQVKTLRASKGVGPAIALAKKLGR